MHKWAACAILALLGFVAGFTAVADARVTQAHSIAQAAPQVTPTQQASDQAPPPDFGSPPSGQIPILYDDHHVYSKPDVLKQDRVLAALVRRGTILIPLRSMFEQMGATVSYDPATRTANVTKAGADVTVTVGKPEVVINGETRPLDVPPIIYHGIVLVPVRVISEGMGAYVQWVPDRHIVVVRYIPATPPPPPPPPPTAAPPPPPPPPPPPVPSKPRWVWRATIKAYDFNRQNATNSHQDSADTQINQQSFNAGFAPHVEYNFTQNWTVGATYWLLEPFNGPCYTPQSHEALPCKVVVPAGHLPTGSNLNFDDTLPGYQISALNEAYIQYQDSTTFFRGGNQLLNTPWAGPNGGFEGSRIMPDAYQSADFDYKFDSNWTIELADSWKYLLRTESDFAQNTNITRVTAPWGSEGYGGLAANIYDPSGLSITTPGFGYGRIGYSSADFTANFHYYDVYDITSIAWIDAKYTMPDVWGHPYIQFQGGTDNSTGTAVVGKIDSELFGFQGGITVIRNVVLQLAYDDVPIKTTTLVLPAGFSCSATTHTISSPKGNKGNLPYFLPSGGTPDCDTVNGLTTLVYGGWASPYTDGYATDPVFTTSLTQGMVDRRAPGQSYMPKLIASLFGHHLTTYVSWAAYDYNQPFMSAPTYEFNYDALFYFNKPPAPGQYYRGLSFRYRYGDRTQPFTNAALPEFKYNRFQMEYDF